MVVSLSNRKRIKRQKAPLPKKNATAAKQTPPIGTSTATARRLAMLTQQAERVMVTVVWHCSMLSEAKGNSKRYTTNRNQNNWKFGDASGQSRGDTTTQTRRPSSRKGWRHRNAEQCHRPFPCIALMTMQHRRFTSSTNAGR